MSTQELPRNAHLDHLKGQAKLLLRSFRHAEPQATRRIGEHFPKAKGKTPEDIRGMSFGLQDALLVVAREYGFANWAELKSHVEQRHEAEFAQAVALIDQGDVEELRQLIEQRPGILAMRSAEDGSKHGDYFAHPYVLWHVAENPVRNGKLPANITEVTRTLVDLARTHGVKSLGTQLNYTISLVASGKVPRECGVQEALLETLVDLGASPDCLDSALANEEMGAAQTLIRLGAPMDVSACAALGETNRMKELLPEADEESRRRALALAAINGQSRACRILVDLGVDPNEYNPEGAHAHATPLHNAISAGHLEAVETLVTRGADTTIKDKLWDGDATGWAEYMNQPEIGSFLKEAAHYMPGIEAIRVGDIENLKAWLTEHPELVNHRLGSNGRTPLHHATDWPGNGPNRAEVIRVLVEAGADVNARAENMPHTETPLHWACSAERDSDEGVAAVKALVEAGADVNLDGGCLGNGTPLVDAIIFRNVRSGLYLLEHGAKFDLPLAAGAGRMDLVESFYREDGSFHNPYGDMPHRDSTSDGKAEANMAICVASINGQQDCMAYLVERGANINMVSVVGTTPLDETIIHGHPSCEKWLRARGAKTSAELKEAAG